jgi:hypothetical protein
MSLGVADGALEDRKLVTAAWDHIAGFGQKHRDVETVGEPLAGLDRHFVAAVNQGDAAALQRHHRYRWHLFGCRGNQACGFRTGRGGVVGPAAGFANVDEAKLGLRRTFGDLAKQRRLLGAGNGDRRTIGKRGLEPLELEAAELVGLRDLALAGATDRLRVERHGLLATADQEMGRRRTHDYFPEPAHTAARLLRCLVPRYLLEQKPARTGTARRSR